MTHKRPGVTIKFWAARFTNRPDVEPPLALTLVAVLCICALTVWLAIAISFHPPDMFDTWRNWGIPAALCVLPLLVSWTILSNYPISRWLMLAYYGSAALAYFDWRGVEPPWSEQDAAPMSLAIAGFALLVYWLFRSKRMRFYYAQIRHRPIPDDLAEEAAYLVRSSRLTPRALKIVESLADRLELIGALLVIATLIYAYVSTA